MDEQRRATIMVVDDSATNIALMIDTLSDSYEVCVATEGAAALCDIRDLQPDLVLLDIMMPGMDGYQVCRALKADATTQQIPVIFLTAMSEPQQELQGLALGAVDYITKPISPALVLARVQNHLLMKQYQDNLELLVKSRTQELELTLRTLDHQVMERTRELQQRLDERDQARQQLLQSEKMASLGRMVAGFSHELNTPLGVGVTATSMIEELHRQTTALLEQQTVNQSQLSSVNARIGEASQLALRNLKRAATLVGRFRRTSLDLTRGRERPFLLKQVIDDVAATLSAELSASAIDLVIECEDGLELFGDPGLITQLLTHLIVNGQQHAFPPARGRSVITVRSHVGDKGLTLEVEDNGIGIKSEHIEQIFEPFYSTTHGSRGGLGLGLFICYNIVVSELQGTILCDSILGTGTRFAIMIPEIESAGACTTLDNDTGSPMFYA